MKQLKAIWRPFSASHRPVSHARRYRDDLSEPRFEKKPEFTAQEFSVLYEMAYKVVDAMVAEYRVPMVLDQATISRSGREMSSTIETR